MTSPIELRGGGETIDLRTLEEQLLLYMIVEHFRNQDPVPVYRRFQDRGRLVPEGLQYLSSWVDLKFERCFQLMETDHPDSLDAWVAGYTSK